MSVKIHHGPPGTYKTSGAIGDDFLKAAKAGRTIITNVRGLSKERTLEVFPDLPETFDVVWLDDKTEEGREKLQKWFHWIPEGAYLFIDEAQDIFPRSWRDADLAKLDYQGGLEAAGADNRPFNWAQAWDKHRHWNWDIVLTAPSIKKIREDIRNIADGAYKHKDLALLGFGGRYIEGFHSPEDAGTVDSHFYSIVTKRVPRYVWKLYDSTTTGQFTATQSGRSIFANVKVLLLLGFLVGAFFFAFRSGAGSPLLRGRFFSDSPVAKKTAGNPSGMSQGGAKDARENGAVPRLPAGGAAAGGVGNSANRSIPPALIPFGLYEGVITGYSVQDSVIRYYFSDGNIQLSSQDLMDAGYTFRLVSRCAIEFRRQDFTKIFQCGAVPEKKGGALGLDFGKK